MHNLNCKMLFFFTDFYLLHHGGFFRVQDVIGEDPGHRHLDGELDTATHGELQEELAEPELGQITALLQGLCNRTHTHLHTGKTEIKSSVSNTKKSSLDS